MTFVNLLIKEILVIAMYYMLFVNYKRNNQIKYGIVAVISSLLYSIIFNKSEIIAFCICIYSQIVLIKKLEQQEKNIILFRSDDIIFIKLVISNLFIVFFEMVSILFLTNINDYKLLNNKQSSIALVLIVIPFLVIIKQINEKYDIDFEQIILRHNLLFKVLINMFLFFMVARNFITMDDSLDIKIIQTILLLGLLLIYNIYYFNNLYKEIKQKEQIDSKLKDNEIINEIINEIRKNEHEYKNHLNTLYRIIEQLPNNKNKDYLLNYIDDIKDINNNYRTLLYIDNPIIKASVYNMVIRCEKDNIRFEYLLKDDCTDIMLSNSELNILLNNLLNNAYEGVLECENRNINLVISNDDGYKFSLANTCINMDINKLSKIFKSGYSTKGKNRGYGLSNINKIVTKYNGKINISLEDNIFKIEIYFKEKISK